ncbi:hypothetical protein OC25_03855 [Pedobacter kyungheensis]|uniref:Histidine kinase n=2 Tax=Pedobacter TaxID=84567 RepID=A0A1G6K3V3_9SPHI|nr:MULTISPECIES: sensor histidine kinase [Pedobacter]KIA96222.1 hypothetical protein OC25_03855 [Pedobacter kyungheensis]SDC25531.1 Histidine kinase [Pedobacter soli]
MEKFSKNELRTHLICWSVYIFVEVVLAGIIAGRFSSFFLYVLFYAVNIGLFYCHALWVMPLLNRRTKTRVPFFLLAVISECMLYLSAATLINLLLESFGLRGSHLVINLQYLGITFWRSSFFIMYATGYFYLRGYLERKDLETQLIMAEKDFLRAQINPHLLFNTLNFIRHATKHNTAHASLAISSLSDLMEYALEDSKNGFVPLRRETEQVENLIGLHQLRFGHLLKLEYTNNNGNPEALILPIILLTLVENVFKHGILNDPDNIAQINVSSSATGISFSTTNLIGPTGKTNARETGLQNISARLEHAYPAGRYNFTYGTNGKQFETRLTINLA